MEETIGQRLKRLRVDKSWSGAEVARRIGTSRSAYCEYENDRKVPGAKVVVRLADALGTDTGYILLAKGHLKPGPVLPLNTRIEVMPVQVALSHQRGPEEQCGSIVMAVLLSDGRIFMSDSTTDQGSWFERKGPWNQ